MSDKLLWGIDFCFNPTDPGSPDSEGHYTLSYGFIKRATESSQWQKVTGDLESATKNDKFIFTVWDLSRTLSQIDFITIAFRPGGDDSPDAKASPFGDSDNKKLIDGQSISSPANGTTTGCNGSWGYAFAAGNYTLKNSGDFEMTIELRCTVDGTAMLFKCDPKIQVGP